MVLAEQRIGTGFPDRSREVGAGRRDVDGVVTGGGTRLDGNRSVTGDDRGRLCERAHRGLDGGVERFLRGGGQREHREVEILVRVPFVVVVMLVLVLVLVVMIITMVVVMAMVVAVLVLVRLVIVLTRRLQHVISRGELVHPAPLERVLGLEEV